MKTEMRCLRGVKSNPFVTVSLDDDALASLARVSARYETMTDKRVTRSVIVRRALHLLADHLQRTNGPTEDRREVVELLAAR
jgi:hypothetical protein